MIASGFPASKTHRDRLEGFLDFVGIFMNENTIKCHTKQCLLIISIEACHRNICALNIEPLATSVQHFSITIKLTSFSDTWTTKVFVITKYCFAVIQFSL